MLCGDWPGYVEDCVFDNELTVFVRLEMVVVYCCTLGMICSVMALKTLSCLELLCTMVTWLFVYTYSTSAITHLVSQLLVILI